jgi:hypothetical protein
MCPARPATRESVRISTASPALHLRGDLEVVTPEGPRQETRVMLRACGRTGNTPYRDHSGVCGERG